MIAIINSGANIASVQFSLQRLGVDSVLTTDASIIQNASRVILPGVGAAASAMQRLRELQLVEIIRTLQQPVLGICLGMQLMFDYSEEGGVECLGIITGKIKKMMTSDLPIPHMGWNALQISTPHALFKNIENQAHVYFVHSFAAPVNETTIAQSTYGETFSASVQKNNFYGTQFHPERSSSVGAAILKNFLEL